MRKDKENFDNLLDRATEEIRSAAAGDDVVTAAGARVRERLLGAGVSVAAVAAEVKEIRGCEDYQRLLPAYLEDMLPEARKLLVEDHMRECVPCRKNLKVIREGGQAQPSVEWTAERSAGNRNPYSRWLLAAVLAAAVGIVPYLMWRYAPMGSGAAAVVQALDGEIFQVEREPVRLSLGSEVGPHQRVRTSRSGGAVLELNDGSLVEMRSRSELSIRRTRRGTTIQLERGGVIVQAAKKRTKHLYVATEDCLVSVTGTIFSVSHGTKGSRVSVVEGEVRVDHGGDDQVLHPGGQYATHAGLGQVPLAEEIAWSRDFDRYLAVLGELTELGREIDQRVTHPDLRYSSALLNLMPQGTVFYGAAPNLGGVLAEAHQIFTERVSQSAVLSKWWSDNGTGLAGSFGDELIGKLGDLSHFLGAEIVVSGQDLTDERSSFLALAEVVDEVGLRRFLQAEVERHGGGDHGDIVFVTDPLAHTAEPGGLYVWIEDGLAAVSPQLERLREVATMRRDGARSSFVDGDFHDRIADLYREGAGILLGLDLETVVDAQLATSAGPDPDRSALEQSGMLDARYLLFEQKRLGEQSYYRAVLDFDGQRRGVASWLAEPASMGVLDFVSPEAKFVASAVFKDPAALLEDVALLSQDDDLDEALQEVESRLGLDLRQDVAAALGGEVAFALDGPMLPTPSWKLVLEVYDAARLQWALEQMVQQANVELAASGERTLEMSSEEVGGHEFHSVSCEGFEAHYTFVEGYLVATPTRALLSRALRFRESGFTFTDSSRFTQLLPDDGRQDFSALVFQDLSSLFQALAETVSQGQLSDEQRQMLETLQVDRAPSLAYAYGGHDRIIFAAQKKSDLFGSGMLGLLGLGGTSNLNPWAGLSTVIQ